MWGLALLLRIMAAGVIAAACGGLATTLLLAFAIAGLGGMVISFFLIGVGIVEAIRVAALPAMVLGGLLWMGGTHRVWLRLGAIWAVTGAAAGLAIYYFNWTTYEWARPTEAGLPPDPRAAIAIFFAAGVIAALAFRRSMKLLSLFGPANLKDAG